MSIATRIRKLGFRRWHERQLIEAHASLVTALLALIVIAVCLDQFRWREGGVKPLIMLMLIAGGIVLCFKTVTGYFKVLFRAEHFAQQAVCGECKVYGALDVLKTLDHASHADEIDNGAWFKVRCRKCGHEWAMAAEASSSPVGRPL